MKPIHVIPTLTLLFLCLVLSSSGSAQDNLKEIRQKLEGINRTMERAELENDYSTQLKYFTDDIMIDHPLEPPLRGKESLKARYERNQKEGVKYHSVSSTMEDLWVSGDRVYERGTWGMSVSSKRVKQPIGAFGSYFQIWRKQADNAYRIEYLIFTLDFNPYELGR